MSKNFADRIRKTVAPITSADQVTSHVVQSLLVDIRQLMEAEGSKDQYPRVNLYCNWSVHPSLRDSVSAYKILGHMAKALAACAEGDVSPIAYCFRLYIGLDELRLDMIDLFHKHGISTHLFNTPALWSKFLGELLRLLEDKPIGFPKGIEVPVESKKTDRQNRVRKHFDNAKVGKVGNRLVQLKELSIVAATDGFDPKPDIVKRPVFHFRVTTTDDIHIVTVVPSTIRPE